MTETIKETKNKKDYEIINISDEPMVKHTDVIDKIMHRKTPYIDYIVRRNNMFLHADKTPVTLENPLQENEHVIRKIRDKSRRKMTGDEIEIISSRQVYVAAFGVDPELKALVQNILGNDKEPRSGTYIHDLHIWLKTYYGAFYHPTQVYIMGVRPWKSRDDSQAEKVTLMHFDEQTGEKARVKQKNIDEF